MRTRYLVMLVVAMLALIASGYIRDGQNSDSANEPTIQTITPAKKATVTAPAGTPVTTPAATTVQGFDKSQHSLDRPTSRWVVVNKKRPLSPKTFVPIDLVTPKVPIRVNTQLRQETALAIQIMFNDAQKANVPMIVSSGYRSYTYQVGLYNGYVAAQGQAAADTQSARPGYSEHQTGMAADVSPLDGSCSVKQCFATTPAGKWLAANAYRYGFIIRYPEGLTAITGYEYEPWHIRYVGVELSTEMHNQNILTMEQFFGLPPAPTY